MIHVSKNMNTGQYDCTLCDDTMIVKGTNEFCMHCDNEWNRAAIAAMFGEANTDDEVAGDSAE